MLSGDYSCGRVKAQRRSGRTVQCSLLASEVARGRGIPDKMHPHEVMPCACFQLLFNARPKSSTVFRSAKTTLPLSRGNTEKTRRDSVVAITQHRLLCKKRATLSMFLVLDTGKDNTRLSLVQQKTVAAHGFPLRESHYQENGSRPSLYKPEDMWLGADPYHLKGIRQMQHQRLSDGLLFFFFCGSNK